MDINKDKVFGKGCGEALTTFLRQMADHNAEVVCPHCGKVYSREEAEALAKAAAQSKGGHG